MMLLDHWHALDDYRSGKRNIIHKVRHISTPNSFILAHLSTFWSWCFQTSLTSRLPSWKFPMARCQVDRLEKGRRSRLGTCIAENSQREQLTNEFHYCVKKNETKWLCTVLYNGRDNATYITRTRLELGRKISFAGEMYVHELVVSGWACSAYGRMSGYDRQKFQYVESVHFTYTLKIIGIVGDSTQTLAFGVFLRSKVNKHGENVVWDWTDTRLEFLKVEFLGGSKVTFLYLLQWSVRELINACGFSSERERYGWVKYNIAEMECPAVTCKAPPLALLISAGISRVPPSLSFSYIRASALNRSIVGVYVDMYSAMYEKALLKARDSWHSPSRMKKRRNCHVHRMNTFWIF